MSINKVMISGNLTRDPELRATPSGSQVLAFGVAVNDRRRNQNTGEWEDVPNFVDCVVFGARAESLSRILTKGMKVAIEGKLRYSSWETKEGQRRSKLEVIVDDVDFMSTRGQGQGGQYQPQQQYQQPQAYQQPQQYQPQQQAQQVPYGAPQPNYAAPAPQQQYARPVSTPPSADVYDEDIPF